MSWARKGAGGGLPKVEDNTPVRNTAKEEGDEEKKKDLGYCLLISLLD